MDWEKTTCVLCGNVCGLEVGVENNRIIRILNFLGLVSGYM